MGVSIAMRNIITVSRLVADTTRISILFFDAGSTTAGTGARARARAGAGTGTSASAGDISASATVEGRLGEEEDGSIVRLGGVGVGVVVPLLICC